MLSWNVYLEDFNRKEIVVYDIFKGKYFEGIAKDIKERVSSKELFAEEFRLKLMHRFWSRSEYEVVITSWPPYVHQEEIERLANEDVKYYRTNVNLSVGRKIDIYDQIMLNWQQFIDYVWNNI